MACALLSQNLDHAFAGLDPTRFEHWRVLAEAQVAAIARNPVKEVSSILSLTERNHDLAEIEAIAGDIADHFSDLVVVGMGGSSLGGETLAHLREEGGPSLHFVDNIDPHTIDKLIHQLPWKTTHFLVISKSGNTVETQAHMMVFLAEAKRRIGSNCGKHFTIITIPNHNPLHKLALVQGMRVVAHDADLCGRFSILSAVGLIPAAVVGVDIRALRAGAAITRAENFNGGLAAASEAAALHLTLMEQGINMQVLMHYCDRLSGLAAWNRQCWSESLGKQGKGTTPIASPGVTDQHSQLQLYLEGPRDKFFTALVLDSSAQGAALDGGEEHGDFAYLAGHRLGDLLMAEQRATNATLVAAGRPLRVITCHGLDATMLGALLMHFTLEVTFTAALMQVNAFDQQPSGSRPEADPARQRRPAVRDLKRW